MDISIVIDWNTLIKRGYVMRFDESTWTSSKYCLSVLANMFWLPIQIYLKLKSTNQIPVKAFEGF